MTERRQPDDVRLELFVPFYLDETYTSGGTGETDPDRLQQKKICDEIVRRYRGWKTKYFTLIRALEWCMPDQEAVERTIQRVRKYSSSRYSKFFELEGNCLGCAKSQTSLWASKMNAAFCDGDDESQNMQCQHQNQEQDDDQYQCPKNFKGVSLLVVFGSAADVPLPSPSATIANNAKPENDAAAKSQKSNNNNNNNDDAAEQQQEKEKEKETQQQKVGKKPNKPKYKTQLDSSDLFFKTNDATSRNLKGFLISNITHPDVLDAFIQRHLLRLMIQMKMNQKGFSGSSTKLLRSFIPMIYEPVRRCSSILVLEEKETSVLNIFLIEPFACFSKTIFESLRDIIEKRGSGEEKINKIFMLCLGDPRDALLISPKEISENILSNLINISTQIVSPFDSSVDSLFNKSRDHEQQTVNFQLDENLAFTIAKLKGCVLMNGGDEEVCPLLTATLRVGQHHPVLTFTGDLLSLDSYIKDLCLTSSLHNLLTNNVKLNKNLLIENNSYDSLPPLCADDCLLVPSHGGYSWVTPQLELGWLGFGYLTRRTLFPPQAPPPNPNKVKNNKDTAAAVSTTVKVEPRLVAGCLHGAILKQNIEVVRGTPGHLDSSSRSVESFATKQISKPSELIELLNREYKTTTAVPGQAFFDVSVPLVLDIRSPAEFEKIRIAGSLSIPFATLEPERSSKKAELWLSQLVLPQQKLIIVVPSSSINNKNSKNQQQLYERLASLLPQSVLHEQLIACVCADTTFSGEEALINEVIIKSSDFFLRGRTNQFSTLPSYEAVSEALHMGKRKENNNKVATTATADSALTSTSSSSFVIDCRTPIEFAQGSHIEAANIPLADFRNWLLFMMKGKKQQAWNICPSIKEWMQFEKRELEDKRDVDVLDDDGSNPVKFNILPSRNELFLQQPENENQTHHHSLFHPSELSCFKKLESIFFFSSNTTDEQQQHQFLIYCAGGYRSRIFMSIFEGAMLAMKKNYQLNNNNKHNIALPRVADVGRGAVELMSQHAELWSVKDRGIVCVS